MIERVTAACVPSSVAHASLPSTSAVTRDVGMIELPCEMKSGRDPSPPASLRASSSHCTRKLLQQTTAATMPSTRKSVRLALAAAKRVVFASPSQQRITFLSERWSRLM